MRMQRMMKYAVAAGLALTLAAPLATHAQPGQATTFSIESVGSQVGLGNANLKETIINIIRWALGFMTLIAVVFIIYAGFIWLTAGGSEENVEKAKRIISAAVIGLIVVLLAWAIVIFVANTTASVTNTTP